VENPTIRPHQVAGGVTERRSKLSSEQIIIEHLRLAIEELIFFGNEAALFLDEASLLVDEALLFLNQRFLRRHEVGSLGAIRIMVTVPIAIPIAVVRSVVAVAIVVDARRFVFDVVTGVRIVRVLRDARGRRTLQDHFGIKLVIVEHPTAFGVVAIRVIVQQFRSFGGAMIESKRFGTIGFGAVAVRRE
jgi:hypothetical protein